MNPPADQQYDYTHVNRHPPIGPDLMMHLLDCGEAARPDCTMFFDLLPKKKDKPIVFDRSASGLYEGIGYGLNFVLRRDTRTALGVVAILDIIVSLAFGVAWSVLTDDTQTAWTVATWILSVPALLLVAWQSWTD
jgi:hypothetical protein